MNILFYLGHPAHFHLFKHCIRHLKDHGHGVQIFIKSKDVLEDLLQKNDLEYVNLLSEGRPNTRPAIALSLLKRDWRLRKCIRFRKPDLMLGTSAEIAHIGRLLHIPSIVVNEDDAEAVPYFAKLAYPLATHILAPSICRVGKWNGKTIRYEGYHELAYLHPRWFIPDISRLLPHNLGKKRFFVVRFSSLAAHHDIGKKGISDRMVERIITLLSPHGDVVISSERELEPHLEKWRIRIDPADIHHALYFADMYIGDSQTMTAEAAVLGTPALRFNDFVRKLSYLDELEDRYALSFGIKTTEPDLLYEKIQEILDQPDVKKQWSQRREKMISEKTDLTSFMIWLIENYPESVAEWTNSKRSQDFIYNHQS
jgi:predicted glycosyltransferase